MVSVPPFIILWVEAGRGHGILRQAFGSAARFARRDDMDSWSPLSLKTLSHRGVCCKLCDVPQHERPDLFGTQGFRKQKSLRDVTFQFTDGIELSIFFDALGNHGLAEAVR